MAKRKMAAECEDFEEFYWPARCRGYLEGKRASDCLANIELARLRRGPCDICRNWYREVDRLRAENERLRERLGHILREATSHAEFFEKRGDVCWTHHWQVIMNIATLEAEP